MATRTQVLESLSASSGMKPMTLERTMRVLGTEGLIPSGSVGHRTPHFGSIGLANMFLAMAAYQPSDAAETVRLLSGFRRITNRLTNMHLIEPMPGIAKDANLFGVVKGLIEQLAVSNNAKIMRQRYGGSAYYQLLRFQISLDAGRASISIPTDTKDMRHEFFESSNPELLKNPVRRFVEVHLDYYILEAAGALLADTLFKQSVSSSEPSPASGAQGEKTAKTAKVIGPASHDDLQSKPTETRAYPTPTLQTALSAKRQSAIKEGSKQLSLHIGGLRAAQARACNSSRSRRYDEHDQNWLAAPTA